MIEPEMAFADLNTYMDTAEAMTKYVIRYLLDNCPDELAFFNQFFDKGLIERLELVANSDFARVSYTDAIELLKKNDDNFQYKVRRFKPVTCVTEPENKFTINNATASIIIGTISIDDTLDHPPDLLGRGEYPAAADPQPCRQPQHRRH